MVDWLADGALGFGEETVAQIDAVEPGRQALHLVDDVSARHSLGF